MVVLMLVLLVVMVLMPFVAVAVRLVMVMMIFVYHGIFLFSAAKIHDPECNRVAKSRRLVF